MVVWGLRELKWCKAAEMMQEYCVEVDFNHWIRTTFNLFIYS